MNWVSRKAVSVWFLMAAILLTACAEEAATPVDADDGKVSIESYPGDDRRTSPEVLVAAAAIDPTPVHQAFAFDDFRGYADEDNTLNAPFDIQQLLAGLAIGAAGETLQVIATAGGWSSLGDSARAETLAGLSLWEQRIDALDSVERQRWLWGQKGYRFRHDYLQAQAGLFGPGAVGLDFRGDFISARSTVEGALDDRLTLGDIGDRSRLVLAQTSRLQAVWPDDLTRELFEGRFGEHEEQRWVDMLRISGELSVAEGGDYRAVAVPLAGDGLSLLVITPAVGAFDAVRGRLDTGFWRQLSEGLTPMQASLNLPVFSLRRTRVDDSGLGIAQSEQQADFSPVNGAGFLYLESLRQSIELQVGEAGLSAATATAVVHTATRDEPPSLFSPPSPITAGVIVTAPGIPPPTPCFYPPDQRSFLFAVYARDTATLLHVGQVKALDGPSVEVDWSVPWWEECGNSPLMSIYRYKGSRLCGYDSGMSPHLMVQILWDAGIDVDDYEESTDGKEYPQVCGGPDGVINVFTIHEDQLAEAEALGFMPLSSLTQVDVYRYKGSRQCVADSGTPVEEMEKILTDAGIEVADSREDTDGKDYLQVCGSADGVINVFTIDESQLAAAEALGFMSLSSLTQVDVYRYKDSRQCVADSGTPAMAMAKTLTDAGIKVVRYREDTDGKDYLQVCDGADGVINIFTIHKNQLAEAEALGFMPLSSLKRE